MARPSWDETWLAVADVVAQRSLCSRRKAGCVLVSADNRIIGSGYNGPPAGYPVPANAECTQWCPRATSGGTTNNYDDCPAAHSEPNALMYSDRVQREGGTAYVTSCPCLTCAKNLANSGIARVVFRIGKEDAVRDPRASISLLTKSGITTKVVS